jgi:hypothetical protein
MKHVAQRGCGDYGGDRPEADRGFPNSQSVAGDARKNSFLQ